MADRPLDNIVWHTLAGPQAKFAAGNAKARRYARGFSPIVGFADGERPDFDALIPYCEPGEHFYCAGWSGREPAGWRLDTDTTMHQYLWNGAMPSGDDLPDAVRLEAGHVPQMLELVAMTGPGPFGPRTPELGEYYGVFENGRLVAMAGERMEAHGLREVSGVCTHPEFQGRGLARRLMEKLIRQQLRRGQTPFLHVMHDNAGARRLYEHMGFRHYQQVVVRVVSRK